MAIDLGYQFEKAGNSTKEFLESGSIIANIVFLILVIIGFVLLLRLGTGILGWLFSPRPNVIVSPGMINASTQKVIPSDPTVHNSVPIMRSQNQWRGIEFTWSVWIFIDGNQLDRGKDRFRHVFSKGNTRIPQSNNQPKGVGKDVPHFGAVDGIVEPLNGPGLYISPNNSPNVAELSLLVRMNIFTNEATGQPLTQLNSACMDAMRAVQENGTFDTSKGADPATLASCRKEFAYLNSSGGAGMGSDALSPMIYDDVIVPEIPINKWVSVIIRLENNNILDVYINGRLVRRHHLRGVARQNYGPTNLALNGGFGGQISELRYFNYAIGTAEIDWIVEHGPNLTATGNDLNAKPYYLANRWFNDNLDPVYSFSP